MERPRINDSRSPLIFIGLLIGPLTSLVGDWLSGAASGQVRNGPGTPHSGNGSGPTAPGRRGESCLDDTKGRPSNLATPSVPPIIPKSRQLRSVWN